MKNGKAPSEDAVKKERLITEIASGVKMLELGTALPVCQRTALAWWTIGRGELKEDPLSD